MIIKCNAYTINTFTLLAAKTLNSDVVEVIINAAKHSFSSEQFVDFVRQIDNNEDSALHLAVRGNHLDVVKLIVQYADPTRRNKDSKSPIYIAAEQGNKEIVKLLCESKFENTLGPGGQTTLHAAITGGDLGMHVHMCQNKSLHPYHKNIII